MPKLKCWKKISDEVWKKNKTELILDKLDGRWDVLLYKNTDHDPDVPFSTPSKKEAVWFAKKYMKDHDSC